MRGIDELDHYELLEIGRGATPAEIDRAYRISQQTYAEGSLALYSVFESMDASAIRDRFDEAYRVLSDPELRAQYDEKLPVVAMERGTSDSEFEDAGNPLLDVPDGYEARLEPDPLVAFDSLGSVDDVVEEFDALEDDGRGEFDGVRLRRNRLFRGYELDDISEVTKVSSSHLRNIEDENFGDLPADVYVRGFVTAYAKMIGLDPKTVVPSYMSRVVGSRSDRGRGRFLDRR